MKHSAFATGKPHMPTRTLVLVSALFWAYVTLSNVLYAQNMQANATQVANVMLFAPWSMRVLQHLLLFPVLLGCFWTSLRVGWTPTRGVPIQVALGLGFAALSFQVLEFAIAIIMHIFPPPVDPGWAVSAQPQEAYGALWTASMANFLLTYSFGVALITGFALYQRFRDAELRMAALEQGWSKARLAALRMQLSPHTLFNLLHTIRGQINQEPQVARSMVMQLADLLRRLLSAGQREFSLLGEELSFVRLYLELQQQRFPDRLTIVLPDPEAQPALWVPSLILQPLVENAVFHGLAGHDQPVTVRVEALPSGDRLILQVVNTMAPSGAAVPVEAAARDGSAGRGGAANPDGIGLTNVRERLAVQFGATALLRVGPVDATTWDARIEMPALRELSPQPLVAEFSTS